MRSDRTPLSEGETEHLYVGCDLGIATVKVALLANDHLLAWDVLPYTHLPKEAAVDLLEQVLVQAGVAATV